MKKVLLSEKLILYFVLLGLGAIIIISTVSFYSTKTALMNRTFDQLTSLRIVKRNQIEKFFYDRSHDIIFIANSEESANLATLATSAVTRGLSDKNYLLKYRTFLPYFSSFIIFRDSAACIRQKLSDTTMERSGPLPKILRVDQINALLRQKPVAILDAVFDSVEMRPRMFIATHIPGKNLPDKNEFSTLVLEISMEALDSMMLNNNPLSGLGLSGETYLVGNDFRMRSTSRFQPNSILQTVVRTPQVSAALDGNEGIITTKDYRGIPVLSSYGKISVPGLDWAILAEIDVQEAMIPIYKTLTQILLLSIFILIIFFACVFFIARHITKPLIMLKNAAVNLGEGHFDMDLPVTTQDEIGLLTESFNIMARQIKVKTSELQQERFGRMRSVIDGEEMERQRLSRELHDGIGQLLIAIKLRLESLLYMDGKDVKNSIQELKKYFDQTIDEVRRISNNLMPSVLEAFGPAIAFRNLFTDTEELSGLRIHFEAKGDFDNLDKKTQTYIYRLTQEALSNIVKHAEASEVWVNLSRNSETLSLLIRDDGKGFSTTLAGKAGGNGIHNMRERVSLLNGQIEIRSAPGKGTTIKVNVPIIIPYADNQDFPRG